jgi:hypothetical protein
MSMMRTEDLGTDTVQTKSQEPTQTPAQALAAQNVARLGAIESAASRTGSYYTGAEKDYIDTLVAGAKSGVYSAEDVLNEMDRLYGNRPSTDSSGDSSSSGSTVSGDAASMIKSYLATYGLESLFGSIDDLMARGIESPDAVLFELRNTEAYQKRFAANIKRAANNLPQLSPKTYIAMEATYREVMKSNGMDPYFNRPDIIESLLAGDVSAQELQSRISDGYRRVREADPMVRQQMTELYNVNEADLAAYFLNPQETMPILTRRAEAAQLAARAKEQGNIQLTATSAEELAARGLTSQQAMEGFATMAQKRGLYEALPGETALTQSQQIGATFGYDPAAAEELARRVSTRKAEFQAGGQFVATSGATSGTIETGLGTSK